MYSSEIVLVTLVYPVGSDFMSVSINRTFTLPLRKLQICECVNIVQDDVTEVDEVFYFVLSSPNPQVRTTGAVVHIVDDDCKLSVTAWQKIR